jgi:hypothetical protein
MQIRRKKNPDGRRGCLCLQAHWEVERASMDRRMIMRPRPIRYSVIAKVLS